MEDIKIREESEQKDLQYYFINAVYYDGITFEECFMAGYNKRFNDEIREKELTEPDRY